ncbi:hypothetical protein GCM10027562_43370 [Arthrobacter pigmenti]
MVGFLFGKGLVSAQRLAVTCPGQRLPFTAPVRPRIHWRVGRAPPTRPAVGRRIPGRIRAPRIGGMSALLPIVRLGLSFGPQGSTAVPRLPILTHR